MNRERMSPYPEERTLPFGAVACLMIVAALTAGCADDSVFPEDPRLPPDAAGFLGYLDTAAQRTSCGNCHVGRQADWSATGHSHAWEDLQSSGAAQSFCEGCHTVNQRGNELTEPAGYDLVPDPRYQDVQCENCHGPGIDHIENPDAIRPLAPISAGVDLGTGCGDCHTGNHHPFVEQWSLSRHATVPAQSTAIRVGTTCTPCHEGKTALISKFGETDDYIEKGDGIPQPITCAICHDPHGSEFSSQLRATITNPTADNICVRCHSRTGTPPGQRGPHAHQGLLVLGSNVGWFPPDFAYDTATIAGTHGTSANPRLCATCHVVRFTVTDQETGDFLFESVGHTFLAIPCLNAQGLPVVGDCPVIERDFSACATSGCHATDDAARTLFLATKARINGLLDDLWADTNGDRVIDVADGGLLPQVVAQGDTFELDVTDDTVTVAEGALWNGQVSWTSDRPQFGGGQVFGISFSAHKGSGDGVHNPFLIEALLTSSAAALIDEYGLIPPAPARPDRSPAQRDDAKGGAVPHAGPTRTER